MSYLFGLASPIGRSLALALPAQRALHLLARILGAWIVASAISLLALLILSACYCAARRLRRAMAESDAQSLLLLRDRRPWRLGRLRLSHRPLTREQGAALESLHHAIDYLGQTGTSRQLPDRLQPATFPSHGAVEILVLKCVEILSSPPSLPSLRTHLLRRLTHLSIPQRN
jgi:hypothetical protein